MIYSLIELALFVGVVVLFNWLAILFENFVD